MCGDVQEVPKESGLDALAMLRNVAPSVLGARVPEPGERAAGHGVSGAVVTVPEHQPLAAENIWRVTLAGEPFGRFVGQPRDGTWRLLHLDELTGAQLDALGGAADLQQPELLHT